MPVHQVSRLGADVRDSPEVVGVPPTLSPSSAGQPLKIIANVSKAIPKTLNKRFSVFFFITVPPYMYLDGHRTDLCSMRHWVGIKVVVWKSNCQLVDTNLCVV